MTDSDFRSVFSQRKDAVYRFAWRMLASPQAAEGTTQDCFVELLRFPERFQWSVGAV